MMPKLLWGRLSSPGLTTSGGGGIFLTQALCTIAANGKLNTFIIFSVPNFCGRLFGIEPDIQSYSDTHLPRTGDLVLR